LGRLCARNEKAARQRQSAGTQEIKVMKRLALVLALAALAGPGDHHVSHQDVRRW